MIKTTTDQQFIADCVTHELVWDKLVDDGSPPKELYFPPMQGVTWLRAGEYGVFALHKLNHITSEAHTILLPTARGKSVEIGKSALKFAFENCDVKRIVTNVPEYNVLALRLALKVGFKEIGVNAKSFQKNGILYDQIFLGISKEDICQ
jgi:RimJ/RimL family protein N-acetyltransferase